MFKIDERYSDYYDGTDPKYPGGAAVDSSGSDTFDGTPWLTKIFNNGIGWMQALYIKAFGSLAGISGDAENAQTSDIVRALDKLTADNNAAERAESDGKYLPFTGGTVTGDLSVTGDADVSGSFNAGDTTVAGKLHVKGDLLVDGTGGEIISTDLKVGADTITLRDKNPAGLAAGELSGVVFNNYDGNGKNTILAVDKDGNARVGNIDIATRFLYSSDGTGFFEDEGLTVPATIAQDEVVRDTGSTTDGGVKIYEGTTFSNDDTQPIATRDAEADMTDGYGVTWDAASKSLKTTFIPSGAVLPTNITGDTTVVSVVADRCFYISAESAVTLSIGNAVQVGIKVRIINTTGIAHTLSCKSVSVNVPKILPMANFEIMWNGSAWQNISGEAVGSTWVQRAQQESPFDVFPCSAWTELVNRNGAFERAANAPTTLYTLDGTTFYADVERLNPVDISGIKNADGTDGTVTDTGETQYNSRGEQLKIYTGSWTAGNADPYIEKSGDLVAQKAQLPNIVGGSSGVNNLPAGGAFQSGARVAVSSAAISSSGWNGRFDASLPGASSDWTGANIYADGGEARPYNYTVRIWRRTA